MTISLRPVIPGIVHVTGEPDTGKTIFGISCNVPAPRVHLFDHDVKTAAIVRENKGLFGRYVDLVELRSKTPKEIDFCLAVEQMISEVTPGEADVLVFDNVTPWEDTIFPYGMTVKDTWRQTWSAMGAVKGAQQWDISFQLLAMWLDRWLSLYRTIILISHLKEHKPNGVPTGKMIPAVKRVIPQKANARVWLRHNEAGGGIPIGLFMKRPMKVAVDPETGFIKPVNYLPRRLPKCTWEEIEYFYENPFNEGEHIPPQERRKYVLNEHELGIVSDSLTKDQQHAYELALQYGRTEEEPAAEDLVEANQPPMDPELKAKILAESGPPAVIANKLGVTVPQVLAARRE